MPGILIWLQSFQGVIRLTLAIWSSLLVVVSIGFKDTISTIIAGLDPSILMQNTAYSKSKHMSPVMARPFEWILSRSEIIVPLRMLLSAETLLM